MTDSTANTGPEKTVDAIETSPSKKRAGFLSLFFTALFSQLESFWCWIDRHQIEQHVVAAITLVGLVYVIRWDFAFASTHYDANAALVLAAVNTPYATLQGAVIKFYFSRTDET
jgi:hypothetical protein